MAGSVHWAEAVRREREPKKPLPDWVRKVKELKEGQTAYRQHQAAERFAGTLSECAKIPGIALKIPNLNESLRNLYRNMVRVRLEEEERRSLAPPPPPQVQAQPAPTPTYTVPPNTPEMLHAQKIHRKIGDAFEKEKNGIPGFWTNGWAFSFGSNTKGLSEYTKLYCNIDPERAPEFVHEMMTWARNHGTALNFQGKFYEVGMSGDYSLYFYIPFEQVPEVVKFLISKKDFFIPADHWLKTRLFPGVSAVIEGRGAWSFDQSVSRAIPYGRIDFIDEDEFVRLAEDGGSDSLLNNSVSGAYFRFFKRMETAPI